MPRPDASSVQPNNPYEHGYISPLDGRRWDADAQVWRGPPQEPIARPPAVRRPWVARWDWWSLVIVIGWFALSLIGAGVAGDPVMGAGWGAPFVPVMLVLWGASWLGFVIPLVLGILAVRAGFPDGWIPIVVVACGLSFLGFISLLAALSTPP